MRIPNPTTLYGKRGGVTYGRRNVDTQYTVTACFAFIHFMV